MLKRLLLPALLVVVASAAEASPGNHLRLTYIPPANPSFPNAQTVNFGLKTLVGFGGSPMAYANPTLLGFTRALAITSVTGQDGNYCNSKASCDATATLPFKLDDRYMLVPKNGAGAYGTTWGAPSHGPYTIIVAEYDQSLTTPLGPQTTITVPIVANAAHVREMTSVQGGCPSYCEAANANPDGGTTWAQTGTGFSFSKSQLYAAFNVAGGAASALCLGDTVYLRDAGGSLPAPAFNPSNQAYRIRPPLGLYTCGSGRITMVSETIDNSNRANGNPQYHNGFQFGGGVIFDGQLSGPVDFPIDVDHVWCYIGAAIPTNGCFSVVSATGGVGLSHTAMEMNPASQPSCTPTVCPFMTGYPAIADAVITNNYCLNMGKCITINNGNSTVQWNIAELSKNDFIDWGHGGNTITDNFSFNWDARQPNHPDGIQHLVTVTPCGAGCTAGTGASYSGNTVARNITVLGNTAATFADPPQCIFASNKATQTPESDNGAVFQNNFCNTTDANSELLERFNTLTVENETHLMVQNAALGNANSTFVITPSPPRGGAGLTLTGTVFNAYAYTGQTAPLVVTGQQTIATSAVTGGRYNAYSHCPQGATPGLFTRAAVIAACYPDNLTTTNGGVVNDGTLGTAGTVNGWLLPKTNGGEICWNQPGLVFDATKTCVQMGTTPAT